MPLSGSKQTGFQWRRSVWRQTEQRLFLVSSPTSRGPWPWRCLEYLSETSLQKLFSVSSESLAAGSAAEQGKAPEAAETTPTKGPGQSLYGWRVNRKLRPRHGSVYRHKGLGKDVSTLYSDNRDRHYIFYISPLAAMMAGVYLSISNGLYSTISHINFPWYPGRLLFYWLIWSSSLQSVTICRLWNTDIIYWPLNGLDAEGVVSCWRIGSVNKMHWRRIGLKITQGIHSVSSAVTLLNFFVSSRTQEGRLWATFAAIQPPLICFAMVLLCSSMP